MNPAVAWLESPESDEWRATLWPRFRALGEVIPAGCFSTHTRRLSKGPVRPEHDPCGRPPLGERDR